MKNSIRSVLSRALTRLEKLEAAVCELSEKSQIANRKSKIFALLALLTLPAHAFPPAPHHLVYGTVRDEMGNPLVARPAEVILETSAGKSITAAIVPGLDGNVNYRLAVPLDAGVTSDVYRPTALRSTAPFKLRVRIGQSVYLPIEMTSEFAKLGQPAEATRLDLTLGEDSDRDGLPDAWERAMLAAAGGKLTDAKPGDDSDGDGLSNLDEYLAGTYAFDGKDGFSLRVVEVDAVSPTLEFMAIRGRSYSFYGSTDLQQWTPVTFQLNGDAEQAPGRSSFQAADSAVIQVKVRSGTESSAIRFFKLRVQ